MADQSKDMKTDKLPAWQEAIVEEIRKQAFYPSIHARKNNLFKTGFWMGHGLAVLPLRKEFLAQGGSEPTSVGDSSGELGMIAKVTAGACHQKPENAAEYFRGFALGLQKGLRCEEFEVAGETQTFLPYLVLMRNRMQVEELRRRGGTSRELADFILTKMPSAQARRIRENESLHNAFARRIQKICERIGLKMASRGRPSKTRQGQRVAVGFIPSGAR